MYPPFLFIYKFKLVNYNKISKKLNENSLIILLIYNLLKEEEFNELKKKIFNAN
jgi:hypothetical protein